MDDLVPPVDVDTPRPPLRWAVQNMTARVGIADRDAVQDVLDRDAGWIG